MGLGIEMGMTGPADMSFDGRGGFDPATGSVVTSSVVARTCGWAVKAAIRKRDAGRA